MPLNAGANSISGQQWNQPNFNQTFDQNFKTAANKNLTAFYQNASYSRAMDESVSDSSSSLSLDSPDPDTNQKEKPKLHSNQKFSKMKTWTVGNRPELPLRLAEIPCSVTLPHTPPPLLSIFLFCRFSEKPSLSGALPASPPTHDLGPLHCSRAGPLRLQAVD